MSIDAYSVGDRVEGQGLTLTQKISGVTKLSPKIIKVIAGGGLALFILLMYAVNSADTVDTPIKSTANKAEVKDQATSAATAPIELTEAVGDGVPSAKFDNSNKGPSAILGNDGQPINAGIPVVPATGNNSAALPSQDSKTPALDKSVMTLAEKRKNARDLAVQSNGSISGFSPEIATVAAAVTPPSVNDSLEAYKASQPKPAQGDGEDDQNKQMRKEKFLKKAESDVDEGYLLSVKKSQFTAYEIKAGSIIPGVLKSSINSDLPGLIRGIVSEDVYDTSTGINILIPKGSTIIGTYDSQIAYGQRRLLAVWTKLIFPDGSTLALKGMPAADQDGSAGLSGEVDNHYIKLFGAALATSVISAGYQLSQGSQATIGSVAQTPGQTMASSLGQQLGQVGTSITAKNLAIQPTIINLVGQRFYVNVTKDIVFQKPY